MPKKYPTEQRERATRMALDRLDQYGSPWAAAQALGPKLGVGAETLRKWIAQAQVDRGGRSGPTSEELAEIKWLRAENRELKEANEILQAASILSGGWHEEGVRSLVAVPPEPPDG
ncbi:MAG: transposase [Mycobacteriales bacterium]